MRTLIACSVVAAAALVAAGTNGDEARGAASPRGSQYAVLDLDEPSARSAAPTAGATA
jgi:hypothetical protein